MMNNLGIYIHVPFCKKKCNYCDFVSFKSENFKEYFDALLREVDLYKDYISENEIDSIFIGGGTPSLVDPLCIEKVLKKFKVKNGCEITIETNPKTLDLEKLKKYKDMGINRISIGMQSANDNELKYLGRIHTFSDFLKSYELVCDAGFSNINVDTMFGIPSQTLESFEKTLNEVKKINPAHISSYSLIIEEGTPFYNMELNLPSEDEERKMYEMLSDLLSSYNKYEISNFAKECFECKHNIKYWTMQNYLGLGLNSHSFIDGTRFWNTDLMNEYITRLSDGCYPVKEHEKESTRELVTDYIITGLRLIEGINTEKINKKFGINFYDEFKDIILKYEDLDMLEFKNNILRFTEKGISVSNYILSDFI